MTQPDYKKEVEKLSDLIDEYADGAIPREEVIAPLTNLLAEAEKRGAVDALDTLEERARNSTAPIPDNWLANWNNLRRELTNPKEE